MNRSRIATAALVFVAVTTCQVQAEGFAVGDRPSEIVGREIWSNKVISTEDYLGKWLLIDFFATWCGPCMHELPNLVSSTTDLRGDKFEVMAVSVDFPSTADKLKPTLREHQANYPCIYQGGGWQTPPVKEWGVNGIPAIFLVNPQGVIVATGLRGEDLRPALEFFTGAGSNLPPISVAVSRKEDAAPGSLELTIDAINPLRTPLQLEISSVQYVPVFAENDPEHKGNPVDYQEVGGGADGQPTSLTLDTSDWGMGSAEINLPAEDEAYYLSVDYRILMPGSMDSNNPEGVWLSGNHFEQLPALQLARERQKAEQAAKE